MVLNVGLLYNIKKELSDDDIDDKYLEFDTTETIRAVMRAIANNGYNVIPIEADESVYEKLKNSDIDIVFNMAEGINGESRESHVPTILEILEIPYTGSGPMTLAICLDKARTKEILSYYKIPTPKFQVFYSKDDKLDSRLKFPLIVKLLHEGSSMGLKDDSVVKDKKTLIRKIEYLIKNYSQPALVEEFIDGREFTVAIMGNENPIVLPIIEICFDSLPKRANKIYSYEAKWVWDKPENPLDIFVCPAKLSKKQYDALSKIALHAYRVLGCLDWCRIDIRMNKRGMPFILELNPIPGILPNPADNSCFPKAARAAGFTYDQLIGRVLDIAIKRYNIRNSSSKRLPKIFRTNHKGSLDSKIHKGFCVQKTQSVFSD